MIVIDASVLGPALALDNPAADEIRERLAEEELSAPELIYPEVASIIRVSENTGKVDKRRGTQAMEDLWSLPLQAVPHRSLMARVWELRHNITPYDASYVALAEAMGVTLVTADQRLSKAPGPRCDFQVWGVAA